MKPVDNVLCFFGGFARFLDSFKAYTGIKCTNWIKLINVKVGKIIIEKIWKEWLLPNHHPLNGFWSPKSPPNIKLPKCTPIMNVGNSKSWKSARNTGNYPCYSPLLRGNSLANNPPKDRPKIWTPQPSGPNSGPWPINTSIFFNPTTWSSESRGFHVRIKLESRNDMKTIEKLPKHDMNLYKNQWI